MQKCSSTGAENKDWLKMEIKEELSGQKNFMIHVRSTNSDSQKLVTFSHNSAPEKQGPQLCTQALTRHLSLGSSMVRASQRQSEDMLDVFR